MTVARYLPNFLFYTFLCQTIILCKLIGQSYMRRCKRGHLWGQVLRSHISPAHLLYYPAHGGVMNACLISNLLQGIPITHVGFIHGFVSRCLIGNGQPGGKIGERGSFCKSLGSGDLSEVMGQRCFNPLDELCKFRSTSNTNSEKGRTPIPVISEHSFRC